MNAPGAYSPGADTPAAASAAPLRAVGMLDDIRIPMPDGVDLAARIWRPVDAAAETARRTFEEGQSAAGLPTVTLDLDAVLLAAMRVADLASSNGEARRSVQGGAVRVNDQPVSDDKLVLTRALLADGAIKLSMGKKKHVLVKPA